MTVKKYDVETFLSDIQSLFKNNLNTKITSINSEKSDSITLLTVDSLAYLYDMDEKAANFDPIVLSSVSDIQGEGQGSTTSKTVVVNVSLILFDGAQDALIMNRMLRYQRCLEEVIEDNFQGKVNASFLKLEHLPIMTWTKSGTSLWYKIASINIIGAFA